MDENEEKKLTVLLEQYLLNQNKMNTEILTLGHLMKYNMYMISQAIVFAAIMEKYTSPTEGAQKTREILKWFSDEDHRQYAARQSVEDAKKGE